MPKTTNLSSSVALALLAFAALTGSSHAYVQVETVSTSVSTANPATLDSTSKGDRLFQLARHGADDPAGDDRGRNRGGTKRGRGGHDDPPGHA